MKSKDIDINQFEKIEDLYAFVDQNAFELERNRNITDLWVAYRNKSSDEGEKQKAQWATIGLFERHLDGVRKNPFFKAPTHTHYYISKECANFSAHLTY